MTEFSAKVKAFILENIPEQRGANLRVAVHPRKQTDSGEAAIFSMSRRYLTQRHRGHKEKNTDYNGFKGGRGDLLKLLSRTPAVLSGPEAGHKCVRLFLRVLCVSV